MSESVPPVSGPTVAPTTASTPASPAQAAATPTPPSPTAANVQTGTIVELPPNSGAPRVGQQFEGVVTARASALLATLETSAGPLILQTIAPLTIGSRIVLQVTLDGRQPTVSVADQSTPPTAATPDSLSLTRGTVVNATVIRALPSAPSTVAAVTPSGNALPSPAAPSSAATPLPSGGRAPNNAAPTVSTPSPIAAGGRAPNVSTSAAPEPGANAVVGVASKTATATANMSVRTSIGGGPPSTTLADTTSPARVPSAAAARVAAPTGRATAGAAPNATSTARDTPRLSSESVSPRVTRTSVLMPGDRLAVRIVAVTNPGVMAQSVGQTRGASFTGSITGADKAGQVTVRTDTVELQLATPRPLPTGGNLLLQIVGSPSQSSDASAGLQTLTGAQRWETLHEFLRAGDAASVRAVIEHAIPQPGSRLAGTLLFFLSALRAGDLRGWLGAGGARLVERQGLFRRMSEEFGSMQRLANEPAGQDWRLFLIPILSDAQLHQMRLFIRDHRGGKEDDEDPQGTRFVLEVTFSKLGPFQFDGLTRDKTLSLIIRTQQDIGRSMHRSIVEIFDNTISALGFTGSVRFRTEAFFEVQPLRDANLPGERSVTA